MATAKKEEVRVPYITQEGQPLHMSSEALQRAYMQYITVDQRSEVLQAAQELGSRIFALARERSEAKRNSRKYSVIPANATPEFRIERTRALEDLYAYFEKLATYIDELKATEFVITSEGFIAPLYEKPPEKPKLV